MSQFNGKKVCLVLSCDRPYYKKRRESNYETYRWFQTNGFAIVFLFADPTQGESQISENRDGTYTLRVQSLEVFELLSHKMELAYKYFAGSGCIGILKIDDDIKIVDTKYLAEYLQVHLPTCDYLGISIEYTANTRKNQPLSIRKYTLNLFKGLTQKVSDITYAGGPFYWISSKTIEHIARDGLEFVYEDVSVGNVVKNHSELKVIFNISLFPNTVFWEDQTETYICA